jgi:hypothetical protein
MVIWDMPHEVMVYVGLAGVKNKSYAPIVVKPLENRRSKL